jgi:hypothetical protein
MATATEERPSRKEMRKLAASLHIDGWESLDTETLWRAIVKAQGPTVSNGQTKKGKAKSAKPAQKEEEPVTTPVKSKSKKASAKKNKSEKSPRKARPSAKRTTKTPAKKNKSKVAAKTAAKVTKKDKPKGKAKKSAVVGHPANPFRPSTALFLITEELVKGGRRAPMIARLLKRIDLHPWAKEPSELDENFEMDKRVLLAANSLKRKYGWKIELKGRGPAEGTIRAIPPSGKSATLKEKPKSKVKAKKATVAKRKAKTTKKKSKSRRAA